MSPAPLRGSHTHPFNPFFPEVPDAFSSTSFLAAGFRGAVKRGSDSAGRPEGGEAEF